MHNFRELKIWKKEVDFSVNVYRKTSNFPKEEMYGLTSQLRRLEVSVPSNIAEGAGRNSTAEFIHFLSVANRSCCEVETQLVIAEELEFIDKKVSSALIKELREIQSMNFKLQETLKANLK